MRSTAPLLLSLGLCAGTVVALVARPVGAGPETPPRVAFVDALEVLATASRRAQIDQDDKSRKDGISQWALAERKRIEDLQSALMLLTRSDPTRVTKEHDLSQAKAMFDHELKWRAGEASQQYADALEAFYREVKAEIKRVAAAQGYTLVLNKIDEDIQVAPSDRIQMMWDDLAIKVATRGAFVYDPSSDITKAVKDNLDKARPATAGGGTVKPPGGVPPPSPSAVPPAPPGPGPAMGGGAPNNPPGNPPPMRG